MRRERDDSDDDGVDIPLHHRRPFGAGLKRKKVEFVKASDPDAGSTVAETIRSGISIGDVYADIVLGERSSSAPAATARDEEQNPPAPPICAICSLPITTTVLQHGTSLAHQVSLAHSHPPSALDRSRMGLRALESQGWDPDSRLGLGREGEGVRFPIKPAAKEDTLGIGATMPPEKKNEVKAKPRPLNAKERKTLEEKERKWGERLQTEIYGRIDVEKYLRGG